MRSKFTTVLASAFAITSLPVQSEPIFFQHRINDPLNLLGAVPAMSAPRTEGLSFQVSATHANVFSGGSATSGNTDELLVLDGAISQLEFRGQLPIGSCYTAALDSRLIHHSGGFLDDEISAWHDFFGLPDANRGDSPSDVLNYFFSNNGVVDPSVTDFSENQIAFSDVGTAVGDLWLSVQRPIRCQPANSLGHVRLGVKLPIGDTSSFGSGGQAAVFADWHSAPKHITRKTRVTSSVGASYSSEFDERFEALDPNRFLGYGAVVFDYAWNNQFQSVVQFDFRSPTYNSELTEVGQYRCTATHVGLRASLARNHRLELSFSEDIAVDTAPDIGFADRLYLFALTITVAEHAAAVSRT